MWEKPSGNFKDYAPDLPSSTTDAIWFCSGRETRGWHTGSLYDVHVRALTGEPAALEEMLAFRLGLITHRLKS